MPAPSMVRFWGRANRNSAPRKRSVACSFWPFDRHKKSNPDNYRASEPSEVHLDEQSCCLVSYLCFVLLSLTNITLTVYRHTASARCAPAVNLTAGSGKLTVT